MGYSHFGLVFGTCTGSGGRSAEHKVSHKTTGEGGPRSGLHLVCTILPLCWKISRHLSMEK